MLGKYDLAIDGGTLEHVFNFPIGIANLMRLASVGGFCYTHSPCNSMAGHGFYQFSPELLFRVFAAENGFKNHYVRLSGSKTISIEQTPHQPLYEVQDPNTVKARVQLMSSGPYLIMSLSEKVADVEPFRAPVLQSDYSTVWNGGAPPSGLNWKGRLVEALGISKRMAKREALISNAKHFKRIW
jgi:hypothetical protein